MRGSEFGRRLIAVDSKRRRRIVIYGLVAIVILFIIFEIVLPNHNAKSYTRRLDSATEPLEKCFVKLAATTQLQLYYAPDIMLSIKQQDTATIRKQIQDCRAGLNEFETTAEQLMPMRLAGYTPTYRAALVNQRQAYDVIGQSNDVMNQYDKLAAFLGDYYKHIEAYQSVTADLNEVDTNFLSAAQQRTLAGQAADLRKRAGRIKSMDAPAGFESTQQDTATLFTSTAAAMESLLSGYRTSSDYRITTGYNQLDEANIKYDSLIVNLPFEQLTTSYIPKQVEQLPVKVENLLSIESE